MSQPDLHPDADSLNAFMERALPAAEHTRILAHMAGCARCREVVYLAQAAAEAEPSPVTQVKPEPRPGWTAVALAKWRRAFIPAAALAATGAVVLWIQLRPSPPRPEMAQVAPQQPAQVTRPAAAANTHRPIPPPAQPSTAPEQKKANQVTTVGASSSSGQQSRTAAVPPAAGRNAGSLRVAGGYHLDPHSASIPGHSVPPEQADGTAQMAFEAALTKPQLQQAQTAALSPEPANGPGPANAVPASPNLVPVHGVAASVANRGLQPLTAQTVPMPIQLEPQSLHGFRLAQLAKHAKLPSGLNTVSSAAILNRLLAVDTAGSVFLSEDGGKRWQAVHPAWSGKAVAVQAPVQGVYRHTPAAGPESLENASLAVHSGEQNPGSPDVPASAPAPPPPAAASVMPAAAPPIPAMLFKLVTERRQTWVSADGKVWRRQ